MGVLKEEWRDVDGYEGHYKVSSFGRLLSVSRMRRTKGGGKCLVPERLWNGSFDRTTGYYLVHLWKDNKCRTKGAHILVAKAFVSNPMNKPEVNHKDGVKTNNKVDNLEWVTQLEQKAHAWELGLMNPPKGEDKSMSDLEEEDVRDIRFRVARGESRKSLAKIYGVTHHTITDIFLRRTWKHVL